MLRFICLALLVIHISIVGLTIHRGLTQMEARITQDINDHYQGLSTELACHHGIKAACEDLDYYKGNDE